MKTNEPATRAPKSAHRRWPRWLRRGPMENAAILIIALGVAMMVQPFSIEIFGWSFAATLTGVVAFTVVSKFPQ